MSEFISYYILKLGEECLEYVNTKNIVVLMNSKFLLVYKSNFSHTKMERMENKHSLFYWPKSSS